MVKLILRDKQYEVKPGMTLLSALEKVGVLPETVIATRNGEMILEDEILRDGCPYNRYCAALELLLTICAKNSKLPRVAIHSSLPDLFQYLLGPVYPDLSLVSHALRYRVDLGSRCPCHYRNISCMQLHVSSLYTFGSKSPEGCEVLCQTECRYYASQFLGTFHS